MLFLHSDLDFHSRTETISRDDLKTLGSVTHTSNEFKPSCSLKTINCSLVRSLLDYASVLWDSRTTTGLLSHRARSDAVLVLRGFCIKNINTNSIKPTRYFGRVRFRVRRVSLREIYGSRKYIPLYVVTSITLCNDLLSFVPWSGRVVPSTPGNVELLGKVTKGRRKGIV